MSTSDAHGIASEAQEREGWTGATLLDVVLDYIRNQGSDEAFSAYLAERGAGPDECAICVPGQCPGPDCPGNYTGKNNGEAADAEADASHVDVTVALGSGAVIVGHVQIDGPDGTEQDADQITGDDDSSLRAAAVAWNALARNGVFTVNGKRYSARECAEWWA